MNIFFIGFFGVLGIYTRYSLDLLFKPSVSGIPYSTLISNCIGCLIAGIVFYHFQEKSASPYAQPIIIGFCGGLTTFSAYALQSFNFINSEQWLKSLTYLILSPAIGVLFISLGFKSH